MVFLPTHELDIVVIAASLGGRSVIGEICAALPVDFPVPILIVQHLPADAPGYFPQLLVRRSRLPVAWATDATRPTPAIYVAPPGRHLVLTPSGRMKLTKGPRENFARPAADPLFLSAARAFGPRMLAVVLTGRLNDGAIGARAVRAAGGAVIAQDPTTCRAPGMPRAAIAAGAVHFVLPPDRIASALIGLTMMPGAGALFGLGRKGA